MPYVPASTINPQAGTHPISASSLEIDAARRAAARSLREVRYYQERYGERGRRFGESDGAWLATLCRGGPAYVESQVLWLGNVLSSRGMPRWLLERHMEILHDELVVARPEDSACYDLLRQGADLLRRRRERYIPQAEAEVLERDFLARADRDWAARLPEMGRLIVAAAADEADGVARAVSSLVSWAGDPARFPVQWRKAVRGTVSDARRVATKHSAPRETS
jgi:hypothetical protein